MKKALSIILWLSIISFAASAKDTLDVQSQITMKLLEEKVTNIQLQLEKSEQHLKELQEAKKEEIERIMTQKEDALDTRMFLYSGFFLVLISIAAWFLNWLGKREIRNIVSEIAAKKIDEGLATKFSNEIVDKKLTELGEPAIRKIIQELTEAGDRAKQHETDFAEVKKKYEVLSSGLEEKMKNSDIGKATPEEKQKVKEFNEVLNELKDEKDFTADDWFWKGVEARDEKKHTLAIEFFTKALNINPNTDYYYANRAYSKNELNKHEEAIQDYDEAIRLNPKNDTSWNNLGGSKQGLSRYEEAIKDHDEAIRLNPKNDSAWGNRGLSKDYLGKKEEAIKDYNEAIRLNPANDVTWNNRGSCKNDLGKYEEAIKDLDEGILRSATSSPYPFRHRAFSHFKLGNLSLALEDIKKAIELKPDYKEANNLKEEILNALKP